MTIHCGAHDLNRGLECASLLLFAVGLMLIKTTPYALVPGLIAWAVTSIHAVAIRHQTLDEVCLGDLKTFRDLAVCLAQHDEKNRSTS